MAFRERLRKTFSRSSSSRTASETSSLNRQFTNASTIEGRKASYIYQPGEKMPPPKYRRPVQKEHKDRLEAFDFATAWRRVSRHSVYSPHGSRMPSRNPSLVSRPALSRRASVVAGSDTTDEGSGRGGASSAASDATDTDLSSSLESWSLRDRD